MASAIAVFTPASTLGHPTSVDTVSGHKAEDSVAHEGVPVCCDCDGIADPDVGTVDTLARMALAARRHGSRLQLRETRQELRELLDLVGLEDLAVEVVAQPEEREVALGVEEEGDSGDPVA